MAGFDHSNTIFVLKPVGPAALEALRSGPNASRLFSFHYPDFDSLPENSRSRKCTPYVIPPPEIQLHLKFDPIPKDPLRGFVFGVQEEECDVVLASYGISRQHFYIGFNWNSGYAIVNNISRAGTKIFVPSKDGVQRLKQGENRALFPGEQIKIRVGSIEFDIVFPVRDQYQNRLYQWNWENFRARCLGTNPNMDGLNLDSKDVT